MAALNLKNAKAVVRRVNVLMVEFDGKAHALQNGLPLHRRTLEILVLEHLGHGVANPGLVAYEFRCVGGQDEFVELATGSHEVTDAENVDWKLGDPATEGSVLNIKYVVLSYLFSSVEAAIAIVIFY